MRKNILLTVILAGVLLTGSIFAMGNTLGRTQLSNQATAFRQNALALNSGKLDVTMDDITISGVVESIDMKAGEGFVVVVKSNDKSYVVHTGPIWKMGANLEENQPIEITGKTVTVNGSTFVVTYRATIDGKEYILRDDNGTPEWRNANSGNGGSYGNDGKQLMNNRSERQSYKNGDTSRGCRW